MSSQRRLNCQARVTHVDVKPEAFTYLVYRRSVLFLIEIPCCIRTCFVFEFIRDEERRETRIIMETPQFNLSRLEKKKIPRWSVKYTDLLTVVRTSSLFISYSLRATKPRREQTFHHLPMNFSCGGFFLNIANAFLHPAAVRVYTLVRGCLVISKWRFFTVVKQFLKRSLTLSESNLKKKKETEKNYIAPCVFLYIFLRWNLLFVKDVKYAKDSKITLVIKTIIVKVTTISNIEGSIKTTLTAKTCRFLLTR